MGSGYGGGVLDGAKESNTAGFGAEKAGGMAGAAGSAGEKGGVRFVVGTSRAGHCVGMVLGIVVM